MLGEIKKTISDFDYLLNKKLKFLYILNFFFDFNCECF